MKTTNKIILGMHFIMFSFLYSYQFISEEEAEGRTKQAAGRYREANYDAYQKCLFIKRCIQASRQKNHLCQWTRAIQPYVKASAGITYLILAVGASLINKYDELPFTGMVAPLIEEAFKETDQLDFEYTRVKYELENKKEMWEYFSPVEFYKRRVYWQDMQFEDQEWLTENRFYLKGFEKVSRPTFIL